MAARYVTVRIGNTVLDLSDIRLDLGVRYSIDDVESPGIVGGAHSKRTILFPSTRDNDAVFESLYDPTRITTSGQYLADAVIEVNGLPVFSGKAQIEKAPGGNGRYRRIGAGYSVGFIGDNATWFDGISDLRIRDLDWGTYTLSAANITDYTQNTYADGDEFTMVLIKWKDWDYFDKVTLIEHTPAIFIRTVLYRAFKSLGYTILSDFFDSDFFSRLVIPVPLKYREDYAVEQVNFRVSSTGQNIAGSNFDPVNDLQVTETLYFTDETTPPNTDPGNLWATSSFIAPSRGRYVFSGLFTVSNLDAPENSYDLDMALSLDLNGAAVAQLRALSSSANQSYGIAYPYNLENNDVASLRLDFWIPPLGSYDFDVNGWLSVKFEKDYWELGDTANLAYLIPAEWQVKDLLLDLIRIFNLNVETDYQAQTVRIEPRDRYQLLTDGVTTSFSGFFLDGTNDVNIDGKLDLDKPSELKLITNQKRRLILGYKGDDETVTTLDEGFQIKLYDSQYLYDTDRFPDGIKRQDTEFFAKTIHDLDPVIQHSTAADPTPQLPLIWPKNARQTGDDVGYWIVPSAGASSGAATTDYEFEPRLLYAPGRRSGIDGYVTLFDPATSGTTAYDFPAAFMVNYNDTSGYDPSLAFGDETLNDGTSAMGLMKRFHLQSIKRWEVGKVLTDWVYWEPLDLIDFSFRNKLYLDGGRYIVQEIDGYNPTDTGSTKTVMLKDEIPTQDDADNKVSGSGLRGLA